MSTRSLWPREHGAYAQLLAPLAAALVAITPTPAAILLALGACLAFLAHEPLLVILGHRGRRLRDEAGARARTRLIGLGVAAVAAGIAGLVAAGAATHAIAAAVAIPAAILVVLAWRRRERTVLGETIAAATLAGAAAPVAVASGLPVRWALLVWLAWTVGFAATVVAVHRVIARHRRPATRIDVVVVLALATVTTLVVIAATRAFAIAVAVPLVLPSTLIVLRPPSAAHLRAIGVALTVAALVAAGLAVATA